MLRDLLFGMAAASLALAVTPAIAQTEYETDEPHEVTDIWDIARGGQLYDKWWAVIKADAPEETHPAYPAAGKKKGSATWRCKECHGWDYMGKDGAYAKGSHFTGIKGVRGVEGMDVEVLAKAIRGAPHGFTEDMIPIPQSRSLRCS